MTRDQHRIEPLLSALCVHRDMVNHPDGLLDRTPVGPSGKVTTQQLVAYWVCLGIVVTCILLNV